MENRTDRKKRALLIINRKSSRGREDISDSLERLRSAGFKLDVRPTSDPASIPGMIRDAAGGADIVILGGGDGTMNTAAEPLVETGLPLGILPLGAANDLADTLGAKSMEKACETLIHGGPVSINLGLVNGKFFFNTAHLGMSVDMVRRLSQADKKRFGFLSYMLKLTRTYRKSGSFAARISLDGREYETEAMEIVVANGVKYGGGLVAARDASLTGDELYCFAIQPQTAIELAMKLPNFYAGTLEGGKKVLFLRGKRIRIETGDERDIMADGEIVSAAPGEFGFASRVVSVYVPPEYH